MGEYKVGTISEILASQASSSGKNNKKKAAKLQALFDSSSDPQPTSVFRNVKVSDTQFLRKAPEETDSTPQVNGKEKKKKDKLNLNKVAGKDADGIAKRLKKQKGEGGGGDQEKSNEGEVTVVKEKKRIKAEKKSLGQTPLNVQKSEGQSPVKAKKSKSQGQDAGKGKEEKKPKVRGTLKLENGMGVGGEDEDILKTGKKQKGSAKAKDALVPAALNGANTNGDVNGQSNETPKKKKLSKAKRDKLKKQKLLEKQQKKKQKAEKMEVNLEQEVKEEEESEEEIEDKKVNIKKEIKVEVKREADGEDMEVDETTPAVKTLAEKNAPKPKDAELEARTVFVGNLPQGTDKKDVKKIFKKLGDLETVRIRGVAPDKPTTLKRVAIYKKEHHPDKSTLSAYIRYSSREEAKDVVEKARGMIFRDNHLILDLAVPEKRKHSYKKSIFVGNLDFKTTDEELWQFFEDCGKISSVRIIRDNQTGLGKGFGYVNFDEESALTEAMRKNNQTLRNRSIRIKNCIKKEKVKKYLTDTKTKPKHSGKSKLEQVERKFETTSRKGKVPVGKPRKQFDKKSSPKSPVGKPRKQFDKNSSPKSPGRNKVQDSYSGDKLAEIGKLKRKSNKPNRGELHKKRIAKMLTQTNKPGTSRK